MYEHLLWDIRTPTMQADPDQGLDICLCNVWHINYGLRKTSNNLVFFDRDIATAEVEKMQAAGGCTIVELTVGGMKPEPNGLAQIATATGTNIVKGCGHYIDAYQATANRTRAIDDFAANMVAHIYEGA